MLFKEIRRHLLIFLFTAAMRVGAHLIAITEITLIIVVVEVYPDKMIAKQVAVEMEVMSVVIH